MKERESLSFAYSTEELADRFLEETHRDDYVSMRLAREDLKRVLGSMSLKLKDPEAITENRNKIIKAIQNNNLNFSNLALMIADKHPLLKSWPEDLRRKELFFILNTTIQGLDKGSGGEVVPYRNFQQALLEIATPLPKA